MTDRAGLGTWGAVSTQGHRDELSRQMKAHGLGQNRWHYGPSRGFL